MKFNTINNVAIFSTIDGTVYTAIAGVFTIPNPTHQIEAAMVGFTPSAETTDPPGAVAVITADAATGGDAEVSDSAAALAALAAAANTGVQLSD